MTFIYKGESGFWSYPAPIRVEKQHSPGMFGQVHYLASIGCPVPGREAQLLFFDQLFTHFERRKKLKISAASWKTT